MDQAGNRVRLKLSVGRSKDDMSDIDPDIMPAFSLPFTVLANSLDNLLVSRVRFMYTHANGRM